MKFISAFPTIIILALAGCDTMNRPISGGSFDPLSTPGNGQYEDAGRGVTFAAGHFVRTSMDNTAFFKSRPKGDADADKLLPRGTSMKVISHRESYVKVELDSGEIGYVPAVMVEDPNTTSASPAGNPGEFQVYPPVDAYPQPLPTADPVGMPPEGAIPTVIDPEAPSALDPVPPTTPGTGSFPAGNPSTGSSSLPPNTEDLEAAKKAEAMPKLEE